MESFLRNGSDENDVYTEPFPRTQAEFSERFCISKL